jgi:glycosyltransferase involved in cell wall biosynthesis
MAAGLPLLVPRSLGFPEAVEDGGNGLLAKPQNVGDWVIKAERILYDQRLQTKMRRKSRELAVKKFSWELCAKKNLSVYRRLCMSFRA